MILLGVKVHFAAETSEVLNAAMLVLLLMEL
jgi:hypothetical protein